MDAKILAESHVNFGFGWEHLGSQNDKDCDLKSSLALIGCNGININEFIDNSFDGFVDLNNNTNLSRGCIDFEELYTENKLLAESHVNFGFGWEHLGSQNDEDCDLTSSLASIKYDDMEFTIIHK